MNCMEKAFDLSSGFGQPFFSRNTRDCRLPDECPVHQKTILLTSRDDDGIFYMVRSMVALVL